MPDWQIKCWSESDFDFSVSDYTHKAFKAKRWGFCSDVVRAHALAIEGGIYLDTDVMMRQSLNDVLDNRAFTAVEAWPEYGHIGILSSVLGAEPGHPFFIGLVDYYKNLRFYDDPVLDPWAPTIYAKVAERWGFRYVDESQILDDGFRVYESSLFPPNVLAEAMNSLAVHCCSGTWKNQYSLLSRLARKVRRPFYRHLISNGSA